VWIQAQSWLQPFIFIVVSLPRAHNSTAKEATFVRLSLLKMMDRWS
jgi:hypothetical protein